jgi:hypothetical protein
MGSEHTIRLRRRPILRIAAFVLILASIVVLDAADGWAYYRTAGKGQGAGTALTLARPASVTATQSGPNTVSIAWISPSGFSGAPIDRYIVRRQGGSSLVDVCDSSSTGPIGGYLCVDTGVPLGTYTYEVTTSYRSWSSSASTSSAVTLAAAAPTVQSITRADADPTNAANVSWTVTFSESVTGVAAVNFSLVASGINSAALGAVTGSGATWTVNASTGTGPGTLALNLTKTSGIMNSGGTTLAANFNGPAYTLRSMYPSALVLTDGGQPNRIDVGDSLAVTLSLAAAQSSLCAAWTGDSTDRSRSDGVVTVVDGGTGNDSLTFAASGCPTLRLGTVALGSTGYVSGGNASFAATVSYAVATRTVLVTFGVKSGAGSIGVVGGSPSATFIPAALLTATTGATATGTVGSSGRF